MANRRQAPNAALEDEDEGAPEATGVKVDMLDRSKPFGEHYPPWKPDGEDEDLPRAHYQQTDGYGIPRHYDSQGYRVRFKSEPLDGTRAKAAKKTGPQVPNVRQQMRMEEARAVQEAKASGEEVIVGDVNLTEWMLKKKQYPWSAVRKAIEERFARHVNDIATAEEFLFHEGVVTIEQLRAAGVPLSTDR